MTPERDRIGEIQDRLRRIETRLTKYMQERGFETQVQIPEFVKGAIEIPSLDVRLKDILAAFPQEHRENDLGEVEVYHQGYVVCRITHPY